MSGSEGRARSGTWHPFSGHDLSLVKCGPPLRVYLSDVASCRVHLVWRGRVARRAAKPSGRVRRRAHERCGASPFACLARGRFVNQSFGEWTSERQPRVEPRRADTS